MRAFRPSHSPPASTPGAKAASRCGRAAASSPRGGLVSTGAAPFPHERLGRGIAGALLSLSLVFGPGPGAAQASLFDFSEIGRDPIEPFTLYGDVMKKFFIENLDDTGKIVSRRKGFTATVCITTAGQSQETSSAVGPLSSKVDEYGDPTCVEVVGGDFERTCDKACSRGCEEQIRAYLNKIEESTGFKLEPGEPRRILVACSKRCFRESQRPGMNRPFQLTWLR